MIVTSYIFQPGNHRIPCSVNPESNAPGADDLFESFFDSMRESFLTLLACARGADGLDHDLIIDAYRSFMLDIAPQSQKIRYQTFRSGSWSFNVWLLNRLQYFVCDRYRLVKSLKVLEFMRIAQLAAAQRATDPEAIPAIDLSGGGEFQPQSAVVITPKFGGGNHNSDFRLKPQHNRVA
jgi:hypothetical protein